MVDDLRYCRRHPAKGMAGSFSRILTHIRTLLRLYRLYGTMDLVWFLRDTKYCFIYMLSDLICSLSSICGIFLLSKNFGGFGGMSSDEVLFMLSYATVVNGIYMMFFIGNNTGMVSRIIGRGQLDHCVIQPVPVWIQLLTQGFSPVSSCFTLITGMGMTAYCVKRMSQVLTATPGWWVLFILNTIASCLIIMAVIYLVSCLAFYAPAAAEEIAQSGHDLFSINTYPLGSLGKRERNLFCLFIPIGLTAWLPSQGLIDLGKSLHISATNAGLPSHTFLPLDPALMAAPCMALLLISITALLFKKGMNYYATNGSPRYSGFGHR